MLVRYLRAAQRDLSSIYDYSAQDDPESAHRVVERLRAVIELLEQFPTLGRPGRLPRTRELVIAGLPYIVPYRVRGRQVVILRLLHTSRQWPAQRD